MIHSQSNHPKPSNQVPLARDVTNEALTSATNLERSKVSMPNQPGMVLNSDERPSVLSQVIKVSDTLGVSRYVDRPRLAITSATRKFTLEALRFSAEALSHLGARLAELAKTLWQLPPQGPVDEIVTRALSGPHENSPFNLASDERTWRGFALEQLLTGISLIEPPPVREMRKIMSYERGLFRKLSSLFSHLEQGLPRLDGAHISVERIKNLPFEYNDPHLQRVYHQLRHQFFPNRPDLDDYKIVWRNRPMQTTGPQSTLYDTLGFIDYGSRTIHIAREMSHPDAIRWLPALLHHELCHAVLVDFLKPEQDAHADWFKKINSLHPDAETFTRWGGWATSFKSYHGESQATK